VKKQKNACSHSGMENIWCMTALMKQSAYFVSGLCSEENANTSGNCTPGS